MSLIQDTAGNIKEGRSFYFRREITNHRRWYKIGTDLFGDIVISCGKEQRTIGKDHIVYRSPTLMEQFSEEL